MGGKHIRFPTRERRKAIAILRSQLNFTNSEAEDLSDDEILLELEIAEELKILTRA